MQMGMGTGMRGLRRSFTELLVLVVRLIAGLFVVGWERDVWAGCSAGAVGLDE
jgi:hypothetical protein